MGRFEWPINQRYVLTIIGTLAMILMYAVRLCLTRKLTIWHISEPADNDISHTARCIADVYRGARCSDEANWTVQLFYLGYVISHLPSGIWADKSVGKIVLLLAFVGAGTLMALAPLIIQYTNIFFVCMLRVLIGLFAGAIMPALAALISQWVPLRERGLLGTLVLGGEHIAILLDLLLLKRALNQSNWPLVFYILALLILIWLILFQLLCSKNPNSHRFIRRRELNYLYVEMGQLFKRKSLSIIPWRQIATSSACYALIAAQTGFIIAFYRIITNYALVANEHYSIVPYLLLCVFVVVCGVLADYLTRNQILQLSLIRTQGNLLASFGLILFIISPSQQNIERFTLCLLLCICMPFIACYFVGPALNPLDLSPNYAGTLMGILCTFATLTVILIFFLGSWFANWRAIIIVCVTTLIYLIWGTSRLQIWNEPQKIKEKYES